MAFWYIENSEQNLTQICFFVLEVIENVFEKYSEDQCVIKSKSPPKENAKLYEPKTQTNNDQVYNTTIRYYSFNKFDYSKVQFL